MSTSGFKIFHNRVHWKFNFYAEHKYSYRNKWLQLQLTNATCANALGTKYRIKNRCKREAFLLLPLFENLIPLKGRIIFQMKNRERLWCRLIGKISIIILL